MSMQRLDGSRHPTQLIIIYTTYAPLGPTIPTTPDFGNENDKSSINNRSPYDFLRLLTLITTSPRRGPGGI